MEYNAHVCCLVGVLDLAGDLLLLRTRPLLRLWLGERREADRDLFIASPDTSKEKVSQMPKESYDAHTGIRSIYERIQIGSRTSNDGAGSIVLVQILYATVIPWDLLLFAS